MKTSFIIVFIIILWVFGFVSSQDNRPENAEWNKDDKIFLNQEPPGLVPKIFAPVFSSNKESRNPNRFDLFISFRGPEGVWLEPQNMGSNINTDESEMDFLLSPDGKYIFFTSSRIHPEVEKVGYGNGRADIYWVNAKIIDLFRPENLKK